MAVRKPRDDRVITGGPERRAGLVASVLRVVEQEDEQTDSLIAALQPDRVLGRAAVEQARLNAAARDEFVRSWQCYTSAEVAEVVGSRATNRAASAHRLLRRGEIFQVRYGSDTLVPAFQFSPHGEPKPAVAEALGPLRAAGLDGWELAFWFVTPNGWIEGEQRPVDLLDADPAAVVAAARREADIPE